MGKQLYVNNFITTLAADISDSATSLLLASSTGAPTITGGTGDWFMLTLVDDDGSIEIVKCTARSGITCTIERAQESTSAAAHTLSPVTVIANRPTKGTFEYLRDLILTNIDDIATNIDDIATNIDDIATNAAAIAANVLAIAANASAIGSYPSFPAGTIALFAQAAAPTGWTKKTDFTDGSVLVYASGTPGSGGSVDLNDHKHPGGSHSHGNGTLYIDDVVRHRHEVKTKPGAGSNQFITSMASTTSDTIYTEYEGSNTVNVKGDTGSTSAETAKVGDNIKYQEVIAATKD